MNHLNEALTHYSLQVDQTLTSLLNTMYTIPTQLEEALHYTLYPAGKRIRPFLVYASCLAMDGDVDLVHLPACAIELIHCYSLIHDDLPAMDNDDYRRGRLTCHKQYDEATAILIGDGLQALAMYCLSDVNGQLPGYQLSTDKRLKAIAQLSYSAGLTSNSLIGGQFLDLLQVKNCHRHASSGNNYDRLLEINRGKTAALFQCAVHLGSLGSANHQHLNNIVSYAQHLGLAFQLSDDLLDYAQDKNKQENTNQNTLVGELGINRAEKLLIELYNESLTCLNNLSSQADLLRELADFVVHRHY